MTGYDLSSQFWDFAYEKSECKVQHGALYSFIIHLNNRLNWKSEFGLPTHMAMEHLSIGDKRTYLSALRDLHNWGFIEIVQEAKNQFQSCRIKLCHSKITPATTTAEQQLEQQQNTSSNNGGTPIDKPLKTKETLKTKEKDKKKNDDASNSDNDKKINGSVNPPPKTKSTWEDIREILKVSDILRENVMMSNKLSKTEYELAVDKFVSDQMAKEKPMESESDARSHFMNWAPNWRKISGQFNYSSQQSEKIYPPNDPNDPVPRKVYL